MYAGSAGSTGDRRVAAMNMLGSAWKSAVGVSVPNASVVPAAR
jgi:hypothetical protein